MTVRQTFLLIFLFLQTVKANHFLVLESVLKPDIQIGDSPKVKLIKKTEIHADFKIKTLKNQFAKFKLAKNIEVSVFSDSEVGFSMKDSKQPDVGFSIELISGQIYVQKKAGSSLDMKSDFFNWSLETQKDINIVIKYDRRTARIEFCNRDKPFEVALFDHEKKITLNASESVLFQGKIEGEKLAFDVLLNQRKIPKGHWQDIKKCSFSEISEQEKKLFQVEALELNKIKKNIQNIKNKKASDDSKFLCHDPYGQLNECLWRKTDQQCIRSRCNAQGEWSDSQTVSAEKSSRCTEKDAIAVCDY